MEKILRPGYYGLSSSIRGEKPQGTVNSGMAEIIYLHQENPDYHVVRQIGEGSHSTVWLAQRNDVYESAIIKGQVCIKRAKEGYESRLVTEYNLLSIIHHPTIIKPIEIIAQEDNTVSIVFPYYLQSAYTLRGRCDMLTVWRFCECISGALEYLHDMGLAHNDVKLSNILVDSEGRFILSDLSAAEKSIHFKNDDIGFACAIIELLTGKTPFYPDIMPVEMIIQELNKAEIHDSPLRKLIIRCLSTDIYEEPGQRNNLPNKVYITKPGQDYNIPNTDYIQWTAVNDFAIVERNNKYGLINRFHQIVIPIENDSLTQVGLLSLPGHPGPGPAPGDFKMRCFYKKGDRCGSYLVDRDFATLELDITQQEWEEREQWT